MTLAAILSNFILGIFNALKIYIIRNNCHSSLLDGGTLPTVEGKHGIMHSVNGVVYCPFFQVHLQ